MRAHLAGLIREQTAAFVAHLARARDGDAGSMHRARVVSRRLREAILLAQGVTSKTHSALMDDIRRCSTVLGSVREISVALQEFESEAAVQRWGAVPTMRVRVHLAAERDRRVPLMVAKLRRVQSKRILTRAETLASQVEQGEPYAWQSALSARVRKRALRLRHALQAVGTMYAAEPLHEVRIAGKKLRYALELARSAAGAPVARELVRLKKLQELLGRLHDLHVLEHHVRQVAVDRAEDGAVSVALDQMLVDLDRDCRALHARFLGQADRLIATAARAGRDIVLWLSPRKPLRIARPKSSRLRPGRRAATA